MGWKKGYNKGIWKVLQDLNRVGSWQSLPEGFFKLNIDEAIYFYIQEAGIGEIVRDNKEDVIMVAIIKEKVVQNP